jgi:hypothetical protein
MVPVLGLVLLVVLLWPPQDDSAIQATEGLSVAVAESGLPRAAASNPELWKAVDMSAISSSPSPFAAYHLTADGNPKTNDTPDSTDTESSPQVGNATSKPVGVRVTKTVNAVIQLNGRAYACIDDQIATVGDTLRDGASVVAIKSDSVVLQTNK